MSGSVMGGSWMTSGEWSGHLFLCFGCVSVTSVYGVSLSGETSSWYKTLANTKISNTEISGLVPGYLFCYWKCLQTFWLSAMNVCYCYGFLRLLSCTDSGTKRRVRYHGWPTDKFIKVRDFKIREVFKKHLFSFLCQECCSETRVYVGLTWCMG